jgi:hypothetical protein
LEIILLKVLQDRTVITAGNETASAFAAIAESTFGFAHLPKLLHLTSERVHHINVAQSFVLAFSSEDIDFAAYSDYSEFDVAGANNELGRL